MKSFKKKKRSLKQAFVATHLSKKQSFISNHLLTKIEKLKRKKKQQQIIITWSRASTIVPEMTGYTLAVHNGKELLPVYITENMLYQKLGDFAPTRIAPERPNKDENKAKRDNKTRH
uniref:Small ribosomal subunit protein uS19c n=1 Tax=Gnetum gnemon TaxID=3382 RepID=A0A1B2IJT1_GNEGN|nr:ribosomal protein S19 [Gnetum gnemon]